MIFLDNTTRSLEVDLTGAVATNQLPFVASYVDINQQTFAQTNMPASTGASNNTTAVTLVAAPSALTTRALKFLSIKNSDTAAVELWVQMNDNATLREIWKGTLAVGDTLFYVDCVGFKVVNSSGALKTSIAGTFTSTRVPFADSGGNLTSDSGFTFNTTGDILTVGAINVTGTTAPTTGWYSPGADAIRTPNSVTIDDNLVVSGTVTIGAGQAAASALTLDSTAAGGTALNIKNSGTTKHLFGGWNSIIGSGSANDTALSAAGLLGLFSNSTTLAITCNGANSILAGNLTVSGATSAIGAAVSATTNLNLSAGTTGVSSLRVPHGSAPTSPVDGDMWTTTAGLYVRVNGGTVGPLT